MFAVAYLTLDKTTLHLESNEKHSIQSLDKANFEMLFRLHFSGLCFFAQKYVKDFEFAREIVQEAFLNLWEKRETIDMNRPVKSYLSMMIHNKCTNHLRDIRKFDSTILNIENLLDSSEYEDTDQLVEEELKAKIDAAIMELPEKCRVIFQMNRFENLKYQEIADKLNISVKTVETQMSKALQHMRIRLAEYISVVLVFATGFLHR